MMSDDIYLPRETDNELQAQIRAAAAFIKKQSDEYWADPASKTCGIGFPHVISPSVYKNGGYTSCSNCFEPLKVEPHE